MACGNPTDFGHHEATTGSDVVGIAIEIGNLLGSINALRGVETSQVDLEKKVLKASEQDRPDVAAKHAAWRVWQLGIDPDQLVFIAETWTKTNMTRRRGRSLIGARLIDKVPHGH